MWPDRSQVDIILKNSNQFPELFTRYQVDQYLVELTKSK